MKSASIARLPNSSETYPEYPRLVNQETNTIDVYLLMGMDDPYADSDPNTSSDINASNFRDLKETLLSDVQFKSKKWTNAEKKIVLGDSGAESPYVEEFSKVIEPNQLNQFAEAVTYRVIIFFGPSGIDEDSSAFHYFLKYAVDGGSVMMYDGHSGLGGHLDLPSIEENEGFQFQPDPNRYQIYYFNSCSSYTYYNTMFFDRKATNADPKGTKSLDILTNGLATYFHVMHDTNMSVIKAIDAWARKGVWTSYQALAKEIDSGNLFGINGDEDNAKKP